MAHGTPIKQMCVAYIALSSINNTGAPAAAPVYTVAGTSGPGHRAGDRPRRARRGGRAKVPRRFRLRIAASLATLGRRHSVGRD